MKKTLLAGAALSIAAAPMAVAHADNPGSYKVIVNGQDLTTAGGTVSCQPGQDYYGNHTTISASNMDASVVIDSSSQVTSVEIAKEGNMWQYAYRGGGGMSGGPGNATVAISGNTYTITGNISPFSGSVGATGNLVPFEFDATCP